MKTMKTALILAIVALVSAGCSKHGDAESGGDGDISNRIVGTWKVDETSPNGITTRGQNSFFQDGAFTSKGTLSRGDRHAEIAFAGTWQINQGVLIETVTNASNTNVLHIGLVTRDSIVSVDSSRFVFRTDDGKVISRERIQ